MRPLRCCFLFLSIGLLCAIADGTSYLGVGLIDADGPSGVEVRSVQPVSPAAKAGLRVGDILVTYNGENIVGQQQLARLVGETPPGRRVSIQFVREGKGPQAVVVTIGARPAPSPPVLRLPLSSDGTFPMPPDIPAPLLIWRNTIFGVECESLNSQFAAYFGVERGILVRYVEHPSMAENGGLRAGDVIVAAGDRPLASPRELTQAFRTDAGPDKPLRLLVIRQHKRITVEVNAPQE